MRRTPTLIAVGFLFSFFTGRTQAAPRTIKDRVAEYGAIVQRRLEPRFREAGVPYPPPSLVLIGFKQERLLEIYAAGADRIPHFICSYPVLAASGTLGPKLRQDDRQVPEGIYRLRALNPNSRFHLSLWIDYPNRFDRTQAATDGRTALGGEIMIHGRAVSKGCFAMGDPAAEDLFVLAALVGIENVRIIFSPMDFRQRSLGDLPFDAPPWSRALYAEIKRELVRYPRR
ncbi:MAG TPA: L,D-transpeptidase family protein [Chthoniobacterales bacterium]|nr:L,D-transpeptidase family protein [Chthoniobacterales bacterium]